MTTKTFYCETCDHNFERAVLETVLTIFCPKCKRWASVIEMAQKQGLHLRAAITKVKLQLFVNVTKAAQWNERLDQSLAVLDEIQ